MTVDDLFQETVARAVESADGFVFIDDNRFVAWITTIARRVIARSSPSPAFELRTVRLRHLGSSGPGIPQASLRSPARTPSSLASREEGVSALREAMDQLPEHYRKVLTLYKLEERPLADVAREMSRTKGATCRLIARATQELRRSLSE
jgi:RNA polymerase sigma factor (sigma-70 family)